MTVADAGHEPWHFEGQDQQQTVAQSGYNGDYQGPQCRFGVPKQPHMHDKPHIAGGTPAYTFQ